MKARILWGTLGWIGLAVVLASCGERGGIGGEARDVPPVTVATVESRALADVLDVTGTLSASKTVDLIARVQGELREIGFRDGQLVEKGQVLFRLERDSYLEQLNLYQAQLDGAEAEYQRQLKLEKANATSVSNVENWKSKRDQATAQVALAELEISYTEVKAPFAGRIGERLVDAGNVVGPGVPAGEKLAELQAFDPIRVEFELSERELLRLRSALGAGEPWQAALLANGRALVGLNDEEGHPWEATLEFVDKVLSTSTGTIHLRGVLANPAGEFLPGQFARIRIPVGPPVETLLVPDRAVLSDQQGNYLLVVGDGERLVRVAVTTGALFGGQRAVAGALQAGARVASGGLLGRKPGERVRVIEEGENDP